MPAGMRVPSERASFVCRAGLGRPQSGSDGVGSSGLVGTQKYPYPRFLWSVLPWTDLGFEPTGPNERALRQMLLHYCFAPFLILHGTQAGHQRDWPRTPETPWVRRHSDVTSGDVLVLRY